MFVPNPAYDKSHLAFTINGYPIYYDAFIQWGYIVIRLVMMLMITMTLTSATKPMDLTYGLEWYLTPLKLVKFPSHIVAMTLSIALRFIPTLIEETDKIMKAQESRGANYDTGSVFARLKGYITVLIPLFVSSFKRAEDLAIAMDARCYRGGNNRTKLNPLKIKGTDVVVFILFMAGAALLIGTDIYFK